MNKKTLIGCIIAVVILVLVSFTSVIGYRSIESDVKVSPLFNIRSSKAIGKESKDMVCDYVGKGEEINITIPTRNSRNAFLQNFIDRFSEMDDETSEKLITNIINYVQKNKILNDENPNKIREAFNLLRDNDKSIPIFDTNIKQTIDENTCSGPVCEFTFGIICKIYVGLVVLFTAVINVILLPFYAIMGIKVLFGALKEIIHDLIMEGGLLESIIVILLLIYSRITFYLPF